MSKTHLANISNAIITLILSLYAYRNASNQSVILLMPVIVAVVLIVFSQGVHYRNKQQTSISLLLVVVLGAFVIYLLKYEFSFSEDSTPIYCYCAVFLTNLLATVYLYKQAVSLR